MPDIQSLIANNLDVWTSAIQKKSSAGRGSNNKRSLHGIKKLRELILELAVRGKLVPQNPNDEPASVLRKKIAAEKSKLIKKGKIKKQKPLPRISEKEKHYVLPQGWEWSRFGDIVFNRDAERVPLSVDNRRNRQGEFDYYGASGVIDSIDDYLFEKPLLLIGEDGANLINRSTPIAFIAYGKYWVNNHAHVLDGISLNFLDYICLHINAISLESFITGTAQPKMNQAKMNTILIALSPIAEQNRIVAKVDKLMALCDQLEQQTEGSITAHQALVGTLLATLTQSQSAAEFTLNWFRITEHFDTLFTTEHSIDQLKQTILQLAVMGKLVPQDLNDEPASVLLEKISKEKARLVKEGKIKKQKPLQKISKEEKPFKLPQGSEWIRFGDLTYQITDGAHHTPNYVDSGVPFLSVKDMSSGSLNFTHTRFITSEQHEDLTKRCNPQKGDLLLTKVGTTGIPILIETDMQFSIFVSVALIKFPKESISGKYLSLLIKSPFLKRQSEEGTEGIGNKNLVLRKNFSVYLGYSSLSRTTPHRR